MKRTALALLVILIVMPHTSADVPGEEPPEFYFTRLVYSGGRGGFGGFGGRAPLYGFSCGELGAGEGGMGGGWATDYPAADCKFMWGVERLTGIRVDPDPNVIEIMDDAIFKYPYVYAVEVGGMRLDDAEAAQLREYLLRGGFLHADDFWGVYESSNFVREMRKVFPDRAIEPVPLTHEVYRTFFDVDTIMQIPNYRNGCNGGRTWEDPSDIRPGIYGISDDNGRLMVLMTYNSDLGDAWEWMDLPCYPAEFSGQAYRMGINFIIYAMTH